MSMVDRAADFWRRWKVHIIGVLVVIAFDWQFTNFVISPAQITLANIGALVVSSLALYLVFLRLEHHESKEVDDRFTAAMGLLGNTDTSVRAGAIYSLYHLAIKEEKYRVQIAQILCAHICSVTAEDGYRKQNRLRPSKDVQTAINVLFRNVNDEKGIYFEASDRDNLPKAELSHAYLVGANFYEADCRGADFINTYCQNTHFVRARCNDAYFIEASCQGADFSNANVSGDRDAEVGGFFNAHCEGTFFNGANCEGTNFTGAFCQGADFSGAMCKNTRFEGTITEGDVPFGDEGQEILMSAKQSKNVYFERMDQIMQDNAMKPIATGIPETARGTNS